MSRSFAYEFHKLKIIWIADQPKALINVENPNLQIIDILQAVARTPKSRKVNNPGRTSLSFMNRQQFSDFLQSL